MTEPTLVGLRIDVDTFKGTREGVPKLLEILARHQIQASFFFSVGPDNMGRHVWRLLKPKFLWKMLRSNAVGLYGLDILLCGTFWPGPQIGQRLRDTIKSAAEPQPQGMHEIGLHAWDHQAWQARIERWSDDELRQQIKLGVDTLEDIIGRKVDCSAVAGWRADPRTLDIKQEFGFRYNSDCRGDQLFEPVLGDGSVGAPQVPVNLPTYDEIVGQKIPEEAFNQTILDSIVPGQFHCYTIHAEVEGGIKADLFEQLLEEAKARNIQFVPLGQLVEAQTEFRQDRLVTGPLEGREGWVGWQASALETQ
ncbi:4-deoxy-4-formamido-L-arabinose-phosphoundecaprenol deformylase [Paraferrimonas sedimenticola]|uniref:Probable 4-deoxy-4-formamido-L-arabinose-phosphoundecaprenol deformylase ArnD n=1 Tax=Paraferrimonas sedimenticola TaxID=375674 RepID=A0AA37RYB1_9GAMM|nr:4-deoxy-4-formamido-L-arabinose-phosphoundecaprenol deformylase [Paraferrimonas sedimenticola]GLP97418.1 putative 4-deoxy-4-formamido-L-arabinose-phosphoundecaprenol deformylase ArnD [Paraferrimonas sedimenticola]